MPSALPVNQTHPSPVERAMANKAVHGDERRAIVDERGVGLRPGVVQAGDVAERRALAAPVAELAPEEMRAVQVGERGVGAP